MMFWQTIGLYAIISAVCAFVASNIATRRFPFDWLAYFVVGLVGGWIGGSFFGAFGLVIDGISIALAAAGAMVLIELDYQLACHCLDPECRRTHRPARRTRSKQESGKPPSRAA